MDKVMNSIHEFSLIPRITKLALLPNLCNQMKKILKHSIYIVMNTLITKVQKHLIKVLIQISFLKSNSYNRTKIDLKIYIQVTQ